jgi:hypothetical protein
VVLDRDFKRLGESHRIADCGSDRDGGLPSQVMRNEK